MLVRPGEELAGGVVDIVDAARVELAVGRERQVQHFDVVARDARQGGGLGGVVGLRLGTFVADAHEQSGEDVEEGGPRVGRHDGRAGALREDGGVARSLEGWWQIVLEVLLEDKGRGNGAQEEGEDVLEATRGRVGEDLGRDWHTLAVFEDEVDDVLRARRPVRPVCRGP